MSTIITFDNIRAKTETAACIARQISSTKALMERIKNEDNDFACLTVVLANGDSAELYDVPKEKILNYLQNNRIDVLEEDLLNCKEDLVRMINNVEI